MNRILDWECYAYGLEGRGVHFDFYTSIINLTVIPGFPVTTDDTVQFIVTWCDQH